MLGLKDSKSSAREISEIIAPAYSVGDDDPEERSWVTRIVKSCSDSGPEYICAPLYAYCVHIFTSTVPLQGTHP